MVGLLIGILVVLVMIYFRLDSIKDRLWREGESLNTWGVDDLDELLPEAAKILQLQDKASASLLQRRLSIGYARAARILDQLEHEGVVGPAIGAKPRDVYQDKTKVYLEDL